MSLKSRCEGLLKQVNIEEQQRDYDYDDDDNDSTRWIPNDAAREALIEDLQYRNAEMQRQLDAALEESEAAYHENQKRTRKLRHEIELLRSNLDCACQKIEELEQERSRLLLRQQQRHPIAASRLDDDDDGGDLLLRAKVQQIEAENQQLLKAKRATEEKLCSTLMDLDRLRAEFEKCQVTQEGYQRLLEDYQRQVWHIEELTASLEEHRNILSRLRTPSEYNITAAPKPSLLDELGNAWLHTLTEQNLPSFYNSTPTLLPTRSNSSYSKEDCCSVLEDATRLLTAATAKNDETATITSLFAPAIDYAAFDLYPRLPDDLNLLDLLYNNNHRHHDQEQPPPLLLPRVRWLLRCFFLMICRWSRFAVILITAVLINLWQGPEAIMEK